MERRLLPSIKFLSYQRSSVPSAVPLTLVTFCRVLSLSVTVYHYLPYPHADIFAPVIIIPVEWNVPNLPPTIIPVVGTGDKNVRAPAKRLKRMATGDIVARPIIRILL